MLFILFAVIGYNVSKWVKIAIMIASFILFVIYLISGLVKLIKPYTSLYVCICSIMIVISMLSSFLYFDVKQYEYMQYSGEQCIIEGIVVETKYDGTNIDNYVISVTKINGENSDHKAALSCGFDSAMPIGCRFVANVASKTFENSDGYSQYDEKVAMLSEGIFISYTVSDVSSLAVIEDNVQNPQTVLSKLNFKLSNVIKSGIGGNAGRLSAALLLGNRSFLTNEIKRDFFRSGVSHILALSGMHMTIIMGVIMFILKRIGVNHNVVAVMLSFFSVFYLALTGFSVSATRSVIMLTIVYLSMLLSTFPDPLTSLGVSGFLILLITPGAVASAAFWMSFSATLGILVYMPSFNEFTTNFFQTHEKLKFILKPFVYILTALLAGVFASIPLVIVLCIFIKEVSLFSIISTVILTLPASALIVLSLFYLPLASVPIIGKLIAAFAKLFGDFILDFCVAVSDLSGVVISLNYRFSIYFAILIGIALAYSLIALKGKYKTLIPFCAAVIAMFVCIGVYELNERDKLKVSYLNCSSTSEMIVISNGGEAVVCDIGNGSNSSYYKVLDELYDSRVTEIKSVILTRYTYAHNSSLYNLFGKEKVREIWLPMPKNDTEYYKIPMIREKAELFGVEVYLYDDGEAMQIFKNADIELYREYIKRSAVPISLISINAENERITYLSAAYNESQLLDAANQFMVISEYIIFGAKGPKTISAYSVPDGSITDIIIFADDIRAAYYDAENSKIRSHFLAKERFVIIAK